MNIIIGAIFIESKSIVEILRSKVCENVRKNEDGNSRSERKAKYNDCFVNGKPYVHSNTVQKSLEYLLPLVV